MVGDRAVQANGLNQVPPGDQSISQAALVRRCPSLDNRLKVFILKLAQNIDVWNQIWLYYPGLVPAGQLLELVIFTSHGEHAWVTRVNVKVGDLTRATSHYL
jgi:hypothetical protein